MTPSERALELETLDDMIQEELLIQKAADLKIEVTDADVSQMVDRQVRETRSKFTTESEYRTALAQSSLGTPDEYRKFMLDQYKRRYLLEKVVSKLKQDGKIVSIQVSDAEVAAEFNRSKEFLPPKPPMVTFKQIVMAVQPSPAAKEAARVRAESLLVRLKAGADFEQTARHESMDPLTKESGGDLGWARRGDNVPEFDRWLFGGPFLAPLAPGQLSSVFETARGFHIVRVDRVQTGEVKSHQILIMPAIDSSDIARTARLADSVADRLRHGVAFDTLAKKFHDYAGKEETSLLTPWVRDSLPASYQKGFGTAKAGDVVSFQIPGSSQRPDVPKFVVVQSAHRGRGRSADARGAQVRRAKRSRPTRRRSPLRRPAQEADVRGHSVRRVDQQVGRRDQAAESVGGRRRRERGTQGAARRHTRRRARNRTGDHREGGGVARSA